MAQGKVHIDDDDKKNELVANLEIIASHANVEDLPLKNPFGVEEVMQQLKEFNSTS